jgi:hypothetical protein
MDVISESVDRTSSSEAKIALFRSLFRGREDVYPGRFESRKTGRSGYAPACANEWVRGVCAKPRVKCVECPNRRFLPVTDDVIRWHLSGCDPEEQPLHIWLFFDEAISAALARRLGSHVLTETMERRPDIGLDSYDRLFPNQDTMAIRDERRVGAEQRAVGFGAIEPEAGTSGSGERAGGGLATDEPPTVLALLITPVARGRTRDHRRRVRRS